MSKIIDVRKSGGELVVLGKAVVLPRSSTDGAAMPLDGSLRFNPTSGVLGEVEIFKNDMWNIIGAGSGTGGGGTGEPLPDINTNTLLGRTDAGTGPAHEITIGEGLVLTNGEISSGVGGAGLSAITGAIGGKLVDNDIIPLGIVPYYYVASAQYSSAHALVPATAVTRITIKKKTGQNAPITVGYFDWGIGDTQATTSMVDPVLNELDMISLEGPAIADATLAHFAFLIRA